MSSIPAINTYQIVKTGDITSFSVNVSSMELYNYITLDVTFFDSQNNVKGYKVITLKGQDYANWCNDLTSSNDDYIINKVAELCGFTITGNNGWANRIGGTSNEEGGDLVTDASGNVYIIGYYRTNSIVINNFVSGGTGGTINLSSYGILNNPNSLAAFIVKYNSSGEVIWVTKIHGISLASTNYFNPNNSISMAIDKDNNLYVSGVYGDNAVKDISIFSAASGFTGQTINTSFYGKLLFNEIYHVQNTFLIKYNSNGIAQWGTNIIGTINASAIIRSKGVSVDKDGNIYLFGTFDAYDKIDINNFSSVDIATGTINLTKYGSLLSATTLSNGFLIKYNTNGVAQWATTVNLTNSLQYSSHICNIYSSSTDSIGNVYVLVSSFIIPVNQSQDKTGSSLAINSFSSVAAGGGDISTTTYGQIPNTNNSFGFVAIVKYNTNGVAQWASYIDINRQWGGESDPMLALAYSLKVDNNGNIFVTGGAGANPIRFYSFGSGGGGGTITTSLWGTITNTQSIAAFLVKYNTNGVVQWALKQDGNGSDTSAKLAVDIFGNVYITGWYTSSSLTVNSYGSGGGSGNAVTLSAYGTLPRTGFQDVYVIKYNTNGVVQWATSITGANSNDRGLGIAVDKKNVYVIGIFNSSTLVINEFSSGGTGGQIALSQYGTLTNSGQSDAFIVKYRLDGKIA